jgi:hypothetical protein
MGGAQLDTVTLVNCWDHGIYPLVNVYIAMERSTIFSWENPLLMMIFHMYVKLPEGMGFNQLNPSNIVEKYVENHFGI